MEGGLLLAVIFCERGVESLVFAVFLEDLSEVMLGDTLRFLLLLPPVGDGGVLIGEESAERMCLLHFGGTALERRGGSVSTVHAELKCVSRSLVVSSLPTLAALVETGKYPEGANGGGDISHRI